MAPVAKHRGGQRQPDLALEKYTNSLEGVPDETTLGRLQSMLETLLSERSHPMIVGLRKQLEQLRNAENLVQRELDARQTRQSKAAEAEAQIKKRRFSEINKGSTKDELGAHNEDRADADTSEAAARAAEPSIAIKDEHGEAEGGESEKAAASRSGKQPSSKSASQKTTSEDAQPNGVEQKLSSDDSRIPHNKKFVANPKSEFVPNQSLPYHTIGIFNEDEADADEETYKRRLGVVSYPKEDLSTLTAGPVPMEDYTRSKPPNQVQFSTYATFLEPYFRQFTEEDIQFLQQSAVGSGVEAANLRGGKRLSPYAFPPLGPHYQQQWAQQDAELSGSEVPEALRKNAILKAQSLNQLYLPLGGLHDLNDQNLQSPTPKASLGPFTERLVAAVMPEFHETATNTPCATASGTPVPEGADDEFAAAPEKAIAAIPPVPSHTPLIDDFGHLEERVKGEFRYVGVLDMSLIRKFDKNKAEFRLAVPPKRDEYADPSAAEVDWINGSEDDEVSRELRLLQGRLKEVSRRNAIYKTRLLPILKEQLAWQEYQSILQDLDKQVDQAYIKRLKQPKVAQLKQKKQRMDSVVGLDSPDGASPMNAAATPDPLPIIPDQKPAIKALMDKRERWISKIGPLFRPAYEMMREYENPKFHQIDDEDAPPEDDEEEGAENNEE